MSTCSQCDKEFKPGRTGQTYCSRVCSNKSRTGSKYTGARKGDRNYQRIKNYAMLADNYGEYCVECDLGTEWNGNPLTLQVDHINGDRTNNTIENLRLLCPNCHTQTETWGQGNRKK